jgi:hypothetical protein
MKLPNSLTLKTLMLLILAQSYLILPANSEKKPLTPEELLNKNLTSAGKYMKSRKNQKAVLLYDSAINSSGDVNSLLSIASSTEQYGYTLMEVRRDCLKKALQLARSNQDLMAIIVKSREYQFYEITRNGINALIQKATTKHELVDLAHKAQELALNDVAHQAMEKAYGSVRTVPQAIQYAQEVKSLGMDDLFRKVYKDLVDDEDDCTKLCLILKNFEQYRMDDLNRYLLKKAVDKAKTVEQFEEVAEGARRTRESDIFKLAEYRAKKLKITQQIDSDKAAYEEQTQNWKENVEQDLAKQQQEAERTFGSGKRFENTSPSGGGGMSIPASGF